MPSPKLGGMEADSVTSTDTVHEGQHDLVHEAAHPEADDRVAEQAGDRRMVETLQALQDAGDKILSR